MILHTMDAQELNFDYSGSCRFEGLEDAGKLTCDPAALRTGYLNALKEFLDTIRRRCAGSLIDYRLTRTDENMGAVLSDLLNFRMGMKGA